MSDVHGRVIVIRLSLEVTHIGTVLWLGYGQVIPATWGGGLPGLCSIVNLRELLGHGGDRRSTECASRYNVRSWTGQIDGRTTSAKLLHDN